MSYHKFNNLAELLNGDPAAKIGQGIFSKDLMGIKCKCSLPSKVNGKCVYKGKFRYRCIIYKVKFSMCDAIYIGNTQQTLKKIMDGHFSDLQLLIENGQKSDSVTSHFKHHFITTTSRIYLNVIYLRISVRDVIVLKFCMKWAANESDFCPLLSRRCRSEKWPHMFLEVCWLLPIKIASHMESFTS